MPRKPSANAKIKQLIAAHAPYKAYKWRCTGRHRVTLNALSTTEPVSCPAGHAYKIITEISMKKYLKPEIERIKNEARNTKEYELGA